MHYYNFHIGDYKSHTHHLSVIEDCAYRRLLDHYYLHELPIKQREIARQIGMRDYEAEVLSVLEEFFTSTESGYVHRRAEVEIAHFRSKIEQASKAGKASAERRLNGRSTDVQPTNNQEPITNNHKPITNVEIRPPTGVKRHSIDCQHQKVIDLYHEHLPNHQKVEVWHDTRKSMLRTRWNEIHEELYKENPECTEDDILKWWADFFKFIAKSKFLTGKTYSKDKRPFMVDLEWIVRPTNFTKIIERKYHGD